MNRIQKTLQKKETLLSIYFTAGYPKIEDTVPIIKKLEQNGVDFIEIGLPFSDPLADGPTIQKSSEVALKNGMSSNLLFEQLKEIRKEVAIPLILMGYFNPIFRFGVEEFCEKCAAVGIDGLIIPDLPLEECENRYFKVFEKHGLLPIFLITPQTSEKRIRKIDGLSQAFIYMVSSASVTGNTDGFGTSQQAYFKRIYDMQLKSPQIVGFGIKDAASYKSATQYAKGAIIGSAFIKELEKTGISGIPEFIGCIK